MLKSKSGDQNFLCTSFRIRPRLVAQAQAQKERQAAKGFKEEYLDDEMEFSDSKNLIRPQNDTVHFGETNGSDPCDVDFANIQIKQEIDTDDDLYEKVKEIENKYAEPEQKAANEDCSEKTEKPAMKRYMLKGSQKRKAKFYGSRIVNDAGDIAAMNGVEQITNMNKSSDADSSDMFQELFNCKVCNKIISVNDMEAHSLEHMNKNFQCQKCGQGYNESQLSADDAPKCPNCNEDIIKIETLELRDATFACDECPETFKSLPEFYEHKSEHQNKQNAQGGFECDFCGKVYQYYHALQFHRRTHRERKVPCLDKSCEMKFRSRKEMELHFDTKHPEKKEYFHCVYEGCTKKFLKNFHLQEHIRVKHYNIKAFQCPWPGCLKEFAAQRHLKIHLLIHRDEKPMKCDHCDYRCRQRSAMNWHMRKHPDVPYKYKRATKSPSVSKSESE
jgi:KRAB domain-containing zinc finger protein